MPLLKGTTLFIGMGNAVSDIMYTPQALVCQNTKAKEWAQLRTP